MFQIGQILNDRYQLVEPLKIAGLRQTWRSIDRSHQTACVVKLLGFHSTLQWQDYERFEREMKILKSLKYDKVPRYLADFSLETEGIHWSAFVQQEISGTSLQTLLDQHHRFSETEIRQIAIDLLQILIHLHEQYPLILHRAIEPDHVILSPERSVYLVGFGSAQAGATPSDSTETGTYGYAPLEQFIGQAVPASDLYAVGATLVHLLTGVCPADLPHYQYQIQFRSFVNIDDRFTEWLTKLLEVDYRARFQTVKQALTALLDTESSTESSINSIEPASNTLNVPISYTESISDRIKIASLPHQLQVNIAKRGIHFSDALWLGTGALTGGVSVLMLFSHVHPALSVLCWLDSLPLFAIGLISALGEAALTVRSVHPHPESLNAGSDSSENFGSENFGSENPDSANPDSKSRTTASIAIQWKCLGIPYRRIQQLSLMVAIDSAASGITIYTENRQYSIGQFSPSLNEAESKGLVREVREWMGKGVEG